MLQDRRLNFHKNRTVHDLAERWREEQSKLFGAPPPEHENKPARQTHNAADEGIGQRYRDHNSASDEVTVKKLSGGSQRTENSDTIDLSSQGLGNGLGEFDRKQVLESLRAVDLSYRRSSSMSSNPAIEHPKVHHEPSSALELVNSVRSQVSTAREVASGSRSMEAVPNIEFEKWEGTTTTTTSRRRNDISKEAVLRQSQLQKAKVPASFLANLSFSQSSDAQTQELRDHQTLPLLPQGLGLLAAGQSSSGVFAQKSSIGHQLQADHFLPRGYHDSPRSHHDSRTSLSSTFAELEKRRLKIGLGGTKNVVDSANEASQSLPHWLREAFKPDQPPPPKSATVSPMITAVAQATSFLYKDCVAFLPPFVHPGPLPIPPRRTVKKRRRPVEAESGRELRNDLNFLMAGGVESQNPSFSSSFQQHFAQGFTNTGAQQLASAPSTSSFSKRPVDFSALPSLDPPVPSSFSRPSPALEELMALKNLSPLPPFVPPPLSEERSLHVQSSVADATPNLVTSSKSARHRHSSPFASNNKPVVVRKGDIGPAKETHSRHRKEAAAPSSRKRKTVSPLASNKVSEEGSPDSSAHRHHHRQEATSGGESQQQLPSWMIPAVDSNKLKSRQKASSKREDGNSSSETESDPRIRGAAGMAGEDGDASSDETVSDDRTQ